MAPSPLDVLLQRFSQLAEVHRLGEKRLSSAGMDFHDLAGNRQPQPRSLAGRFGREERVAQLARVFRHDAVARVVNLNNHTSGRIAVAPKRGGGESRSEEHTSELQ